MQQKPHIPTRNLQSQSRSKLWLVGLFCVLALSMLAYRGLYRGLTNSSDLGLYYCSTVAMVQTGDPYSPDELRELAERTGAPTQFIDRAIAPPICYTPLLPFAALPWPAARILWAGANLFAVFMLWYWLTALARIPRKRLSIGMLGLAAFVAGFAPLQTNIAFGQLAVLASAAVVGAIALAQQGKTRSAAGLYVLAGLLKPQLAIAFGIYWLYKREWRLIAYTIGIGLGITLLTLGWLQFKNPDWWAAYADNFTRLTREGGASDYTREGAFIFSDLRVPMYTIFHSKSIAASMAWTVTILLGLMAYLRITRGRSATQNNQVDRSLQDLHVSGLVACLGMLPIYHVYYDSTILLLTAAWAIATLCYARSWQPIAVLLLLAPMLIPGQPMLNYMARRDILPAWLIESTPYQWFILPHLPWLTIAIALCMMMSWKPKQTTTGPVQPVT